MISIEFQQVSIVVHRDDVAEIVFPNTNHVLEIGPGNTPVAGTIELAVYENGVKVTTTARPGAPERKWIPEVGEVAGNLQVRPRTRQEIAKASSFRAMFVLHGGDWKTGRARPPKSGHPDYGDSTWHNGAWKGKLTNWVAWEINPAANRTYVLEQNGKTFLQLNDGDSLVLTNRDEDHPDDEGSGTVFAEDFDLIYAFVNNASGSRPVRPATAREDEFAALPSWQRTIKKILMAAGLFRRNPRLPLCPVGQTEEP